MPTPRSVSDPGWPSRPATEISARSSQEREEKVAVVHPVSRDHVGEEVVAAVVRLADGETPHLPDEGVGHALVQKNVPSRVRPGRHAGVGA